MLEERLHSLLLAFLGLRRQAIEDYSDSTTAVDENVASNNNLTNDETILIHALWNQSNQTDAILQELVIQALPTMSPKLIMKLKQQSDTDRTNDNELVQQRVAVAMSLQSVLDDKFWPCYCRPENFENSMRKLASMSCRKIGYGLLYLRSWI